MSKEQIVRKIKEKFGVQVEPWKDEQEIDPDTPMLVPNRRNKRDGGKRGGGSAGSIGDVLRLGSRPGRAKKTGQPHWFRQMKYNEMRRKALEKVDLRQLEPAVGPVVRDLYYSGGYKNVWQLTQVEDINTLLLIGRQTDIAHGVRVQELKKLRAYLIQQRVPVKWEV